MKTTNLFYYAMALLAMFAFTSCDDDDDDDNNNVGGETVTNQYVVAASSGENNYLVTGSELATTTTYDATSGNAYQALGDRFWTFVGDKVLYGFIYNQTDPGTTASYVLDSDGQLTMRNELSLAVSIHTRGEVNGNLVLAYSDRLRDTTVAQYGYFYDLDPETDASTLHTVITDDLLEEGEAGYFTDIAEYEGYMIAGARSISSAGFTSEYLNNTYVVVFNADFTVKKVIKDAGRTGFVAGMKYSQGKSGLEVVDNGDLYVFSSGQTNYVVADSITIPSGILKINKGEFEFDTDYFYDITEASGGFNLFRTYYVGGTTFVLKMYPGKNSKATFGIDADRFAVVDVAAKTFSWVSNFPVASGADDDPFLVGTPFVDMANAQVVVPVTTSEDKHFIYTIDPTSATASKTSEVIAEGVKAIGILEVQN